MKPMSDRNRISVLLRCLPIAAVLLSVPVLSGCGGAAFGDVRADAETAVLTLSEWDASWTDKLQKLPALETLDLRGAAISVEDAAAIQAALGDAELLWSIPLGSGAYASDSREITVSDLSAEQVQHLCLFDELERADLRGSSCGREIAALQRELPDTELLWTVEVCGKHLESTETLLDLSDTALTSANIGAIAAAAESLPKLEAVDVRGTGLTDADIDALAEQLSGIALRYTVEIAGKQFASDAAEIDLSNTPLDGQDVDALAMRLARLTVAETVDLHGTGLSVQAMETLYAALPDAMLLWTVPLYGRSFESDAESIDLSGMKKLKDFTEFHETVGFFRKLKTVDLSYCGASYEELDELNSSYPDIRIVWTVLLRGERTYHVRTDAKTFSTALKANPTKKLDDRSVAPIKYCTDLIALDLGHNKVRDLSILSGMKNLQYLILVGCDAVDISPLAELTELRYVELFANDIVDLTPLANKPNLLDLNLSNNEITDLSPLFTNPQLERLWISRNPLAEGQQEAAAAALPNCSFDYTAWNATGNGWRKHDRFYEMRNVFGLPIID